MFLIYMILGGLGLLHAVLIHRNLIGKAERRGYARWHDEEKKRQMARNVAHAAEVRRFVQSYNR
jgi:hypothetical protein